jgi:exopolyphosphatase/guanosine-5'-triphosphate,3'-diphosphate pyrophosphatase
MKAFKQLIEAYEPVSYAACGTSALREASNGPDLVRRIKQESLIDLEIVEGAKEAELICLNHPQALFKNSQPYLYVDVGGGSTELTIIRTGQVEESISVDIGTVRLLNKLVKESTWKGLKQWCKLLKKKYRKIELVGSGGNINKLFRMARLKSGEPLSSKKLHKLHKMLNELTVEERIDKLELRPDRADVIVPAADIFLSVLKWTSARKIHVPQIGLADGLVHKLYNQYLKEQSANTHKVQKIMKEAR